MHHAKTTVLCLLLFVCAACSQTEPPKNKNKTTKTTTKETPKTPVVKKDTHEHHHTPKAVKDLTAEAVKKHLNEVKFFTARSAKQPTSTFDFQKLAQAHMALAALTGNVEHYKSADAALKKAFATDKNPKTGPFLTRAAYAYSVHDIKQAQSDADTAKKQRMLSDIDKRRILAMDADLHYHRGELPAALEKYRALIKQSPTSANIAKLGNYYKNTGQLPLARQTFDDAIMAADKENNPLQHAWTMLMRGIVDLDSGNIDKAMGYFNRANKRFPGWYLIREHLAEVLAAKGLLPQSEKLYIQVLKTTPNGEFMDALADVYEEMKKPEDAKKWRAKAKEAYERDLKLVPSSAYGHALDHYLTNDKTRALELAKANHALRPGMDAKLKLAQAHMLHKQDAKALALVNTILKSPFSTAELHATAYVLFTRAKQADKAKAQKAKAIALHPDAIKDASWLTENKP